MPRTSDKLVTQADYSRSRKARGLPGGTRKAVHLAVSSGRIDAFGPDKLIDPGLADRQWAENTRVRAANDAPAAAAVVGAVDLVDQAAGANTAAAGEVDPAAAAPTSLATDPTYQDARARQAVADARTAELKLAELEGQLVRVDQVHAAFASKLAPVREALLQIAARLAPLLAAQSDSGRIQTLIEAEIHKVLAPLSTVGAAAAPEGTGG